MARWYGSINNRIMESGIKGQPTPVVDMGATITSYTDRDAGTIEAVERHGSYLLLTVREDKATRIDKNGMSESQTYEYERNPLGNTYIFRAKVDKSGVPVEPWHEAHYNAETKRWSKSRGHGLRIGERDKHHDFSF